MKFLCDQCKAKYQISDDKVAGKTVRMKCRKCGHLIEVRAAVTETSVAAGLQSDPPPPPAAPGAGPPPRPPPGKPSTLPKSPLATSLAQAKPPVPRPQLKNDGGLATAFKSSMEKAKEDEAALLELSSADEWYAAINGVPVGPIRIAELRRKAALGAVTDDSLVWQEGMEEWRPVKTIPEIASLVREAASTGRAPLATPEPPNVARASVLPPAPSMRPPGPARPTPPRPISEPPTRTQTAARSNVVPITSRLATAERLEEAPSPASERFSLAPDPFSTSGPAAPAPPAPLPAASAAVASPAASAQAPVIVQMPRQTNFIGIGLMLMMGLFGAVAAWAVFFKKPEAPPAPTVNTVYLPAPVGSATAVASADPNAAPAPSATAGNGGKRGGGIAAAPKPSGSAADLHGLLGGAPTGGANPLSGLVPPTGGPAPTGGGGQLSGDQMETVMKQHGNAVKRVCGGIGEAHETVHVTIDGSGHVTRAIAEGTNGTVGTCLEHEIKNWVFPATGGTTGPVDMPFKFITQ